MVRPKQKSTSWSNKKSSSNKRDKPNYNKKDKPSYNKKFDKRDKKPERSFSQSIEKIPNLIILKNRIYTKNLNVGVKVYGERLTTYRDDEYREWDPNKSKLCAAMFNGLNNIGLREDMDILYLGSSTGTTVSHLSDIITDGKIFALDFSPRVHRELVFLSSPNDSKKKQNNRTNIFPLLANVIDPSQYAPAIPQVDLLFQDVAQKNQLIPFIKNIKLFLKQNGIAMISVKSRSIDVVEKPANVFKQFGMDLEKHFNLMEKRILDPYEKDHCLFVVKQKK